MLPFSMQPLGFCQTLPDQFYVPLRGGDATLRFLLKRMQNVKRFTQTTGRSASLIIPIYVYWYNTSSVGLTQQDERPTQLGNPGLGRFVFGE